jgi:hypothetical protein
VSAYDGPFEAKSASAVVPPGFDVRLASGDRGPAEVLAGRLSRDVWIRRGSTWIAVQPPRFATSLDSWFTFAEGRIRPRNGIASLPLADGVVFTDRDSFVATRSAVASLLDDSLTTIGVPVEDGRFRLTGWAGEVSALDGPGFAAVLGDRWLYGIDLRLWLSWPRDPSAQSVLRENLASLADALGASVWAPPVGGSALVVDGELVARDRSGAVAGWQAFHPAGRVGAVLLGSDALGRLVVGGAPPVVAPATSGVAAVVRRRPRGVDGVVNESVLELVVESAWPVERVAREGLPVASLQVVGSLAELSTGAPHDLHFSTRIENGGGPQGGGPKFKIRVRVQPGGALKNPAGWLIPAALLDRTTIVESGRPLVFRSKTGIPEDAPRLSRPLEAYAVPPTTAPDFLPAYRNEPATGRSVRLRLEPGQAIDVTAAAQQADETPLLRTRLPELRLAGVELLIPRSEYPKIAVRRPQTTLDQLFEPVS